MIQNRQIEGCVLRERAAPEGRVWLRLVTPAKDSHGTVILPSGGDLSRHRENPIWLWMHQSVGRGGRVPEPDHVIGRVVDYDQTEEHLDVLVEFDLENTFARTVYSKIKRGFLNSCSVGFDGDPVEREVTEYLAGKWPGTRVGEKIPVYERWVLLEGSTVILGSNPEAKVVARELARARNAPAKRRDGSVCDPLRADRYRKADQRRGDDRALDEATLMLVDVGLLPSVPKIEKYGWGEHAVRLVDGETVRQLIDQNFTEGGNPSRYGYVPLGEIWIEQRLTPHDQTATMIHEIVEHLAMSRGATYDEAHDVADAAEAHLRAEGAATGETEKEVSLALVVAEFEEFLSGEDSDGDGRSRAYTPTDPENGNVSIPAERTRTENTRMAHYLDDPEQRWMCRSTIGQHLSAAEMHAQLHEAVLRAHGAEHPHAVQHRAAMDTHLTHAQQACGMLREYLDGERSKGGEEMSRAVRPESMKRSITISDANLKKRFDEVVATCSDFDVVEVSTVLRSNFGENLDPDTLDVRLTTLIETEGRYSNLRSEMEKAVKDADRAECERIIKDLETKNLVTPATAAKMRGSTGGKPWNQSQLGAYAQKVGAEPVAPVQRIAPLRPATPTPPTLPSAASAGLQQPETVPQAARSQSEARALEALKVYEGHLARSKKTMTEEQRQEWLANFQRTRSGLAHGFSPDDMPSDKDSAFQPV